MTGSEMVEAILDINPDAEVVILGDNYADIQWGDTAVISLSDLEARKIEMATEYTSQAYSRARANEYPDYKIYLDAIVKGDETQKQKYIDDCNAVKLKYPKG